MMLTELELPGANEKKKWESVNTDLEMVSDMLKKMVESKNNCIISGYDTVVSRREKKKEQKQTKSVLQSLEKQIIC